MRLMCMVWMRSAQRFDLGRLGSAAAAVAVMMMMMVVMMKREAVDNMTGDGGG